MKPLTQQDINRYRQDIKQNHIQGVVRTYADSYCPRATIMQAGRKAWQKRKA